MSFCSSTSARSDADCTEEAVEVLQDLLKDATLFRELSNYARVRAVHRKEGEMSRCRSRSSAAVKFPSDLSVRIEWNGALFVRVCASVCLFFTACPLVTLLYSLGPSMLEGFVCLSLQLLLGEWDLGLYSGTVVVDVDGDESPEGIGHHVRPDVNMRSARVAMGDEERLDEVLICPGPRCTPRQAHAQRRSHCHPRCSAEAVRCFVRECVLPPLQFECALYAVWPVLAIMEDCISLVADLPFWCFFLCHPRICTRLRSSKAPSSGGRSQRERRGSEEEYARRWAIAGPVFLSLASSQFPPEEAARRARSRRVQDAEEGWSIGQVLVGIGVVAAAITGIAMARR